MAPCASRTCRTCGKRLAGQRRAARTRPQENGAIPETQHDASKGRHPQEDAAAAIGLKSLPGTSVSALAAESSSKLAARLSKQRLQLDLSHAAWQLLLQSPHHPIQVLWFPSLLAILLLYNTSKCAADRNSWGRGWSASTPGELVALNMQGLCDQQANVRKPPSSAQSQRHNSKGSGTPVEILIQLLIWIIGNRN